MKSLPKVLPVLLLLLAGPACSKREGCRDTDALNFDANAEKDGTCRYTKAIFYAPTNRVGGTADRVVKIEIFLGPTPGQELIGTITTLDHSTPVGSVAPQGGFEFKVPGSEMEYIFMAKYYYEDGSSEGGDNHLIQANPSEECHLVELTLSS